MDNLVVSLRVLESLKRKILYRRTRNVYGIQLSIHKLIQNNIWFQMITHCFSIISKGKLSMNSTLTLNLTPKWLTISKLKMTT